MSLKSDNLKSYLQEINSHSKFTVELPERGGYLTFSNSGQRGSIKYFSLGLDSFIITLQDIIKNHSTFSLHENYVEGEWRDLSLHFSDNTTNALSTVQTKPFFSTLSKLIFWANQRKADEFDDNKIALDTSNLIRTIAFLEELANEYSPKAIDQLKKESKKTTKVIFSHKDLNNFAFETFKLLIKKYAVSKIFNNFSEKDSVINEVSYKGIKLNESFGSSNLIGVFDEKQEKENLKSGGVQRFFDENLHLEGYPYSYFTTQWADVETGNLTFKNLERFISTISNNSYTASKIGDKYSLSETVIISNAPTLQKIYYGAPGTGKSHKIENILKYIPENQKERITFHPEYDYSCFVGGYKPSSDATGNIQYKFVPQVFTKIYINAWKNPFKDYYLAIEEINRGNCAEIFGDLFQLLDRNSNYSISPAKELREHLEQELASDGQEGILNGKMKLPANLHIIASMNTSDQSLFPMDSAFKRRWSWEYVPINYESQNEDNSKNESFDYIVRIDDQKSFKWIEFIERVNFQIKSNRNLGSDKCIGNYFIKPQDKEISLEEFINKAIFYLWIDVFKDEEESIFSSIEENISYEDFFPINSKGAENILKLLSEQILDVDINELKEEEEEETEQ